MMTADPVLPDNGSATEAAADATLRRDGLGYVWRPQERVELRVDYLRHRGDDLHAEMAVRYRGQPIHQARLNLAVSAPRTSLAKLLMERSDDRSLPWDTIIEKFCVGVIASERVGEPPLRVGRLPIRPTRWVVDQLLQEGKATVLFGPGGSGKSYLSVAVCVATATHRGFAGLSVMEARSLYLDWEDDAEVLNRRVQLIAGGFDVEAPELLYQRMRGRLPDHVNRIGRLCDGEGITLAVVDSVSAAAGSAGEGTSYETIAHTLFDALDELPGVTWLLIDHVAGDGLQLSRGRKPFGSVMKLNRARVAWEVRTRQEPGAHESLLTLHHAKWNHTGFQKPIGLRLAFSPTAVRLESADAIIEADPSQADRIEEVLSAQGEPLTVNQIALLCRIKPDQVRPVLHRGARPSATGDPPRFQRIGDGWFLAAIPEEA